MNVAMFYACWIADYAILARENKDIMDMVINALWTCVDNASWMWLLLKVIVVKREDGSDCRVRLDVT